MVEVEEERCHRRLGRAREERLQRGEGLAGSRGDGLEFRVRDQTATITPARTAQVRAPRGKRSARSSSSVTTYRMRAPVRYSSSSSSTKDTASPGARAP